MLGAVALAAAAACGWFARGHFGADQPWLKARRLSRIDRDPDSLAWLWMGPEDAASGRSFLVNGLAPQGSACEVLESVTLAGTKVFKVRAKARQVEGDKTQMRFALLANMLQYAKDEDFRAFKAFVNELPEGDVEGWTVYVAGD